MESDGPVNKEVYHEKPYDEQPRGILRAVCALFDAPPLRAKLAESAIRERLTKLDNRHNDTDAEFQKLCRNKQLFKVKG